MEAKSALKGIKKKKTDLSYWQYKVNIVIIKLTDEGVTKNVKIPIWYHHGNGFLPMFYIPCL